MSPLKVARGSERLNPLALPLPEVDTKTDPSKKTLELVRQIKDVQDLVRQSALAAQKLQETQANKKRRAVDFTVGDSVHVKKKGFSAEAPTTKLDSQWVGPWIIEEERGHSFVLQTPDWHKGSKLFHADRLRKAAMDPLPQQHIEPKPPEEINREPDGKWNKALRQGCLGRVGSRKTK